MAHLLLMPEVAADTTEVVLGAWSVPEGEDFQAGAVLATVETAKVAVDVEAESDGVFVRALVVEGAEVEVGAAIALLAAPDENIGDVDAEIAALVGSRAAASPSAVQAATAAASTGDGPRLFASPLARRLARDNVVALEAIRPNGPNGRVVRRDVEAAIAAVEQPDASDQTSGEVSPVRNEPDFRDEPHSRMRRAIATGLSLSKHTVPHFYLRATADADARLRLRGELNETTAPRISVTDLLVKAIAVAHGRVPAMNVVWTPDATRRLSGIDIAVAVDTDGGLLTPVLRRVSSSGLDSMSAELRDLTTRARAGTLRRHELEGGACTLTNLGMFGTEEFTAIINPPQFSILAVGAIRSEAIVRDGSVLAASMLHLTLSVDHRAIDGVTAAAWMRELIACLERPIHLLRVREV